MLTTSELRMYQSARRAGYRPSEALDIAKVNEAWERAEYADQVRIVCELDTDPDLSWLDDGAWSTHEVTRQRDFIACHGIWVVRSQWRETADSEWEDADCISGCIYERPDCPLENCYVTDLRRAALDALANGHSRCVTCGHILD